MFICYTMLYNVASFSIWFPSSGGKDLGTSDAGSVTVVDLDQYNNQKSATQPFLESSRNAPRHLWEGALRDDTKVTSGVSIG